MSHCSITTGSCITRNRVRIWTLPSKLDCPQVKRFDRIHNVQLHVNEFKKVEISQLGISFHSQTTCSS